MWRVTRERAYHALPVQAEGSVRRHGLRPQNQAHADEQRCLPPGERAIFFAPTLSLARVWGPVVVSFPWPQDAEEDAYGDALMDLTGGGMYRTSYYTREPVAPDSLRWEQS